MCVCVCVCVCVRLSLKFLRWLYSFTMSAITKYHKLGRWKQQKCIVSEFGNLELLKSGSVISTCYHRQTPSKGSGEESLLASSGFWWLLAVLGTPHLMSAWLQSLVLTWPSSLYFCMSQISCLLWHQSLDLGSTLNPGRWHPQILSLITSAKTLFPDKFTFTCTGA